VAASPPLAHAARQVSPRDLLLLLGALVLLVAWEVSGWDLTLIRVYGGANGFAWRDHWFTSRVLHEGGRWLAGAILAVLAWDAIIAPLGGEASRRERRYWLGVVIVALALVPAIKRFTSTSCPWDLAEFGGAVAYVPHWLPFVRDGGPGHCFPSGHSVSAFAFLGTYFLWRAHNRSVARAMLAVIVGFGIAYSWAQMARGAHFASHGLWSAWLCWAIAVVALRYAPRLVGRARAMPPSEPPAQRTRRGEGCLPKSERSTEEKVPAAVSVLGSAVTEIDRS